MTRPQAYMEGWTEFYPYCYMLIAADTALNSAKLELMGRNYHFVTAVVFAAFAVEAAVNHVGIDHYPEWMKKPKEGGHERKPWKEKVELLATRFEMPLDFTIGAAKTVLEAFEVRDKLAHGKTWVGQQCYLDDGQGTDLVSFPDWLQTCLNGTRAKEVVNHSRAVIGLLFDKAGYPQHNLQAMGVGSSPVTRFCESLGIGLCTLNDRMLKNRSPSISRPDVTLVSVVPESYAVVHTISDLALTSSYPLSRTRSGGPGANRSGRKSSPGCLRTGRSCG